MALPPQLERLTLDDFSDVDPKVRDGMEKLFSNLSPYVGNVTGALSKGLTLSENIRCQIQDVTVTVPDDWVPLTLASGWSAFGAGSYGTPAVRKTPDGIVRVRGAVVSSGTPAVNDVIATFPSSYAPAFTDSKTADCPSTALGLWHVDSDASIRWIYGASTSWFILMGGSWSAADCRPAAPGSPFPLEQVLPDFQSPPTGVEAIKCIDLSDKSGRAAPAPRVAWEPTSIRDSGQSKQAIRITNLVGLAPLKKYRVTLLIWG
jgi:hypothetical protein